MKFLVDSTAGKLCRWLRILGHDTEYDPKSSPGALLARARREGRVLLSRSRTLGARDPAVAVTIEADFLEEQLRQLARELPLLEGAGPFTRCLVCNAVLEPVPRERARNRVPDYVFQTQGAFGYCGRCDRFYWKATHWEAMRDRLGRIFGSSWPGAGPNALPED
jgi:uncharacterized protein with PIN domain